MDMESIFFFFSGYMRKKRLQGLFAKFVDLPYYYELELCGGAVMVSYLKYLSWQAVYFLQHPTHLLKMCCRPLITLKFRALELCFYG
jgi:hypothetical protein